jgi:hypothetical protein
MVHLYHSYEKNFQKDPAASIVVIADVAIDLQVPFQIGETCRAEISTEKNVIFSWGIQQCGTPPAIN